jgi:hypothetical protein
LPPWAVQDSAGTIMEIELSPQDRQRLKTAIDSATDDHIDPEICLKELPLGVYVKLDNCDQEFLPPQVCDQHRLVGYCKECDACRAFPGWVLVEPICRTWSFIDPVRGATFKVSRTQLPIMPEAACPLYSLQGATCDPGLIAHFTMPKRTDADGRWLIIYVMLSRVRSLQRLRSIGLTSKIREVIEGGPPISVAENFDRLFRKKINLTMKAAKAAKTALGWK